MAFLQADIPDIVPEKFEEIPVFERMRLLSQHWVEVGFGAPKIMHSMYLIKGLFFFLGGWLAIGLSTPGLPLTDLGAWWGELIVYQKAMIWVILWSATGFNEPWGPLAFKFKPNTAGYRYWMRTGTLRLPPWPDKVPFTKGDERRAIDVMLYVAMLGTLLLGLVLPGQQTAAAYSEAGLVPAWPFITFVAIQLVMGLRDRVTFLASRPEQYSVIMLGFGVLTMSGRWSRSRRCAVRSTRTRRTTSSPPRSPSSPPMCWARSSSSLSRSSCCSPPTGPSRSWPPSS